jgi:hypothetical protein
MTRVTKALTRECDAIEPRTCRPYIVRLEAGGRLIRIKLKGCRLWYTIGIEDLFLLGAKIFAAGQREDTLARQQARKAGVPV